MYIIITLLAGCQSSILPSNEWHNDVNPAFISTIMAPNFKIKEITSGMRRVIKGDKIRSGYITLAFSGVQKWADWLHNP